MKFFLSFIAISLHVSLFGQYNFKEKHFTANDGLSQRNVSCIVQDSSQLMWIGTKNGLNLFDGYRFEKYMSSQNDANSISSNTINDLAVSSDGIVWVATDEGINLIDRKDNSIDIIDTERLFPQNKNIKRVIKLDFLKSGRKFFSSFEFPCADYNYIVSEKVDSSFIPLVIKDENISYEYITEIFEDKLQNTWVRPSNAYSLYQINSNHEVVHEIDLSEVVGNKEDFERFSSQSDTNSNNIYGCNHLKVIKVNSYVQHDSTFLLVSLKDTLYNKSYVIHLESKQILQNKFSQLIENGFIGQFLITYSGGFIYQDGSHLIYNDKKKCDTLKIERVSKENRIEFYFQSTDQTIWLGTPFGLSMIKQSSNPYQFYLQEPANELGYKNSIRAIEYVQPNIFTTINEKGVYQVHTQTKEKKLLMGKRYASAEKTHEINPFGIVFQDSLLWLSNRFDPGILYYDLKSTSLHHLVDTSNVVGFGTSLTKIGDSLWQGTDQGINVIDLKHKNITLFEPSNGINTKQYQINCIRYINDSIRLVGTEYSGVFLINKDFQWIEYLSQKDGLSSNRILSISHNNEFLWIGTSDGLLQVNRKNKEIKVFDKSNGLVNNKVYSILIINEKIWCATDQGISIFNPTTESFKNINKSSDLPHLEFNLQAYESIGKMDGLFGGLNGIVWITDTAAKVKQQSSNIILTSVSKYDSQLKEFSKIEYSSSEEIEVYPIDNLLTFNFSTSNYFNATEANYFYKIEGLEESWLPLGKQNQLIINRMQSGTYVLKVKAFTENGLWTSNELSIPIEIIPVLYKRPWFIILLILAICFILYLIYSVRINNLKKLEKLRLKIASDLHDEVGSNLTYISMQANLLMNKVYPPHEVDDELNQLATGARTAVKSMSDVVWSIDSRKNRLNHLIDRMRDELSEINSKSNINFEFQAEEKDLSKKLNIEIKQNLYLIFREAVNNIIKHSNANKAEINIQTKGRRLVMLINDNGSTNKNNGTTGQGLKNMEMRAMAMKGSFTIERSNGFNIRVSIPL